MNNNRHALATRRRFLKRTVEALLATGWLPLLSGCDAKDVNDWFALHFTALEDQINLYRKNHGGLSAIPVSPKLGVVAFYHWLDVIMYHPADQCPVDSNGVKRMHSWSDQPGIWKGGCFLLENSSTYHIMWDKPKEITGYPTAGYEIAVFDSGSIDAATAMATWDSEKSLPATQQGHLDVILNRGIWSSHKWQALGAFAGSGFACAWFGETFDPG